MKEIFEDFLARITKLGGDARQLVFEEPASIEEILNIEKALNFELPHDFRNTLLTMSANCEFKWFLPDDFPLPYEFREIFRGGVHWGLKYIIPFNDYKASWEREVFPNPDDDYDKVWHNKFAFQDVGNGDYLSIDLSPHQYGKIIYLSHDDGEGHGYVMANSFSELLQNWSQLGCVGGEDWQWLPFCSDKYGGINPNCPNAIRWKQIIGII